MMSRKREKARDLGMARLYVYRGKRQDTYYTITRANQRINLGHDLRAAKRQLLELDMEQPKAGTIAEHLADYMAERERLVKLGKLAPATLVSNRGEVVELNKAFGKMAALDVKPSHVWQYLHLYRGKESPIRANREIALFSGLFRRLLNAGIVERNPCQGIDRNPESSRDRLVTDEELTEFVRFTETNGHLADDSQVKSSLTGKRIGLVAKLSYLTGKAKGQLLSLKKEQLLEEGIYFQARKRGSPTLVEWTPALREVVDELLEMPSRISTNFVIHNLAGQRYTEGGFNAIWQRVMNAWELNGHERFTLHDMRAKAVTKLKEDGRVASEVTGHRTEEIPAKVYDRRRVRRAKAVE